MIVYFELSVKIMGIIPKTIPAPLIINPQFPSGEIIKQNKKIIKPVRRGRNKLFQRDFSIFWLVVGTILMAL
ncbi:hypothetical protein [Flexithrix dorotheae]|uniref:hypothetical protein n=1 Tax=Flexithrix dorotheae TaxID=70993 RepID=UPI0012F767F5|nr:hypothetical protein [Flexithrix dorotheae]